MVKMITMDMSTIYVDEKYDITDAKALY